MRRLFFVEKTEEVGYTFVRGKLGYMEALKVSNYRFQHVLCPFCEKSYTTMTYDEYDVSVIHDGKTINGWNDTCPKCGRDVFVVENELKGKDLSEYPDDEIHRKWILR